MYEFKLPDIGEGLSEGELLEWLVNVGDHVREGQEIANVSTDKVNVEMYAPCSGTIAELCWKPGDIIPVGEVFVRFDIDESPKVDSVQTEPSRADAMNRTPHTDHTRKKSSDEIVKASPAVRRYAGEKKVALRLLSASGPDGFITRNDVDAFLANDSHDSANRITLSGARRAAADRLTTASQNMATATMSFEVAADALMHEFAIESSSAEAAAVKLTPLTLIVRCVVRALREQPMFNATIDDQSLLLHDDINLGIAVHTDDGLFVPVIRRADTLSTVELAEQLSVLSSRARAGKLSTEDLKDATFTVSSTGGMERVTMTATTPIINWPCVATLWVSRVTDRPRVVDGALDVGPTLTGSLSFDHRFLQGADGMAFINGFGAAICKSDHD